MIDLIPDGDQQAVADSVAAFLAEKLPVERLDAERRPGAVREHALWSELAAIGCFALGRPEALGGVGLSLAEEALAFREYGRHLVTPSVLASVLARELADRSGDHALAGRIAAGEQRAALALPVGDASVGARAAPVRDAGVGARAAPVGDASVGAPAAPVGDASVGARVRGEWQLFDLQPGDLVLAWAGSGLALLPAAARGDSQEVPCTDESLSLVIAKLDAAPPLHWLPAADGDLALHALVLVAAQLVGMSEAVRDMAVAHAGTRMQFGQPIGTFQAIKHRCADMALRSEGAWSQTVYAALGVRERHGDAEFQAVTAKAVSTRAALDGAADNIQVHGGMGFTAEIPAHLFLKRAHLWNQAGGNLRAQHARLAALPPPL